MIAEVFEEPARPVEHAPSRAVDVEVGLDPDLAVLQGPRRRENSMSFFSPRSSKTPLTRKLGRLDRTSSTCSADVMVKEALGNILTKKKSSDFR